MIAKLHNVFLWFALAISVCIGFSGTVTADEATECRRALNLDVDQFQSTHRSQLRKLLPPKITKQPEKLSDFLGLWVTWKAVQNKWIVNVDSGKLFVRYTCNGLASSLPSSISGPYDVAGNKSDRALCELAVTTAMGKPVNLPEIC